MNLQLKRVYDPPSPVDGLRILVDRLWPRGISKTEAHADLWMKDIAPSTELRIWFNHDPNRWNEFRLRYLVELRQKEELIATIREKAQAETVTLLYGSKDLQHNHAVVLEERIRRA
jgi:uncharacterized protein YeaO (DUF488 family)